MKQQAKAQGTKEKTTRAKFTSYRNKYGEEIRVGDTVQLSRTAMVTHVSPQDAAEQPLFSNHILKTKVQSILQDTKGYVQLKRRLGGYWTWHVNDLRRVQ